MPNKKYRRSYNEGGLLDRLRQSSRTLTLGQRTKDKVARDILRDEAELPPPMRGIVGLREQKPLDRRQQDILDMMDQRRRGDDEDTASSRDIFGRSAPKGSFGKEIVRAVANLPSDIITTGVRAGQRMIPGGEKPDWRTILMGDIGRASGGIIGLNRGGRIPRYAWGGALGGGGWGSGQQTGQSQPGVMGGGGWQGGGQQGGGMGGQQQGGQQAARGWQGGGMGGGWQGGQQGAQQQGAAQPVLNAPGTGPGYQAQALPEGYGTPAQYAGYGGPAQMESRQEFVAPEVAQQYADLTQGIMQVGTRPYEQYQGPQLAGFTDMEAAAQAGYGAYGTGAGPQGTIQAQSTLDQAAGGIGSMVPKYQTLGTQYQTAGTGIQTLADKTALEQRAYGTTADTLGQATETAQRGYGTAAGELGTSAAEAQRGYGTAADTATETSLGLQREKGIEDYATQSAVAQRELGAELGDPTLQKGADLSGYMSQYTQGVTDPQLQQLMEFQKMQGQELGSQAAGAGAFGGLRQGVQAATQARDVSQQAADIIGKSQQEAFQSAQAAQAADVARTQAGQQAELAAERGALAAETGQQAAQLSAEQQALQQQMRQEQFGAGQEQAAHQTAMDAQRFGAGQEQAAHQARMDAERFGLSTEQAAHQAAMGGRQANLAAMKAQQGAMGAEMGAYTGLAGIGTQQMNLGQQQQQQQMQRLQQMKQAGASQRQLQQAALDIQKQQWEQQQQQPERQIAWMNQQLGALPYQNIVQQGIYAPQAGAVSNLMGAGIHGAGLWNAWQGRQGRQRNVVNPGQGALGATAGNNRPGEYVDPNTGYTMIRSPGGKVTEAG